jgi:hypothetical protein
LTLPKDDNWTATTSRCCLTRWSAFWTARVAGSTLFCAPACELPGLLAARLERVIAM